MDDYKGGAYEDHDALIELGRRPTRKVLEKAAWRAVYETDDIRIVVSHRNLDGVIALNRKLMLQHRSKERERFDDELTRRKEFRVHQQTAGDHLWLKIGFDPNTTDPLLAKILVKLNDWREFQHYQQMKVRSDTLSIWRITRALENVVHKEAGSAESASCPNLQYQTDTRLGPFFIRQMALETSQSLLTWVDGQVLDTLAETSATLEANSFLQQQLETRLEQQAHALYQELQSLEARPDRSVQTPSRSLGFIRRVYHWASETTRLMKDLWEWRVFLKWRRKNLNKSSTSKLEGQASDRLSSHVQVWVDFVAFRQYELDRTRSWVRAWQRMLPEMEDTPMTTEEEELGLDIVQSPPTNVRSYMKAFQQDIHTAETRLRSAEQQLAQLSSQQSSSASVQVMQNSTKPSHLPPYTPEPESSAVYLFKGLTLDSPWILPEVHRTVQSTKQPICGAPYSVQSSIVPDLKGGRRIQKSDITKKQAAVMSDCKDPIRVSVDDDICMSDTCEAIYPHETVEEGADAAPVNAVMSGVEDILTNAGADHAMVDLIPVAEVKNCGTRGGTKSPSSISQLPSSRQTQSATKDNDILSSRTPMKICKSSKKVKPMKALTLASL